MTDFSARKVISKVYTNYKQKRLVSTSRFLFGDIGPTDLKN